MSGSGFPKYLPEINWLRGLACLAVLTVHTAASFYYENGASWDPGMLFLNQIFRFGTPIFAVISGFLLFYPLRNRSFSLTAFVRSKAVKIGSPFLIWGLVYWLLLCWHLDLPAFTEPVRLVAILLFGESFYHLYFMSIVLQFYLIFPLLQRFLRSSRHWGMALVLSLVLNTLSLSLDPGWFHGWLYTLLSRKAFLPDWIFYFIFGGFLAWHWEKASSLLERHRRLLGWAGLLVVAAAVWEYMETGPYSSKRLGNLIHIPILTAVLLSLYPAVKRRKHLLRPILLVGSMGFGIYLVHPLVIFTIRGILPDWMWLPPFYLPVWTLVLLLSMGLVKGVQRLPFSRFLLTVPPVPDSLRRPRTRGDVPLPHTE